MVDVFAEYVRRLTGTTPEAALAAARSDTSERTAPWVAAVRHGWTTAEPHDDTTADEDPFADLGGDW